MKALLPILLSVFILVGCQAITGISNDYPSQWPELALTSESQCSNISGTYIEKGKCNYPHSCSITSLSERLLPKNKKYIDGNTVTIKHISNNIEIAFATNDGLVTNQLSYDSKDFTCENGAIWIKQGESYQSEGVGMASRKYIMGFKKASDGSLIGQHLNSGWGLVMWVIPVGGTQVLWYKWAPTNE